MKSNKSKTYKKTGRAGWNSRKYAKWLKKERGSAKIIIMKSIMQLDDEGFDKLFNNLDDEAKQDIIKCVKELNGK